MSGNFEVCPVGTLQRLAAVEAERDALKQTLHDELDGNLRLRELGGARPDEPFTTFVERVIAERDALLSLISDDAFAASFQTMAQYRSALLKSAREPIDEAPDGP